MNAATQAMLCGNFAVGDVILLVAGICANKLQDAVASGVSGDRVCNSYWTLQSRLVAFRTFIDLQLGNQIRAMGMGTKRLYVLNYWMTNILWL